MSPDYNDDDLEQIRFQLGQIIKSWPKIERIIKSDFVGYAITTDDESVSFVILSNSQIIFPIHHEDEAISTVLNHKILSELSKFEEITDKDVAVVFSLQEYRFTELIPIIEKYYRTIILSLY